MKVGTRVKNQCFYQAAWTGEIIATNSSRMPIWIEYNNKKYCLSSPGVVLVKVTHDRCGNSLKKPIIRISLVSNLREL